MMLAVLSQEGDKDATVASYLNPIENKYPNKDTTLVLAPNFRNGHFRLDDVKDHWEQYIMKNYCDMMRWDEMKEIPTERDP